RRTTSSASPHIRTCWPGRSWPGRWTRRSPTWLPTPGFWRRFAEPGFDRRARVYKTTRYYPCVANQRTGGEESTVIARAASSPLSALGMVVLGQVVAIVSAWSPDTFLAVGVGTRLAIGVIFLFGASRCRIPAVIYGIGILALAGALLLVLLGEPRVDALVHWLQLPSLAIRA